jgi:hemolysin activation/secretion protein
MTRACNRRLAARARSLAAACLTAFACAAFAQTGEVLLEVRQFALEGDNPLSEQEAQSILAPHLGRHTSLATIEAAANALETAMRGRGYSFHRVIVPAQRPADGVVRLQILQFRVAEVTVSGNQYFTSENVLRAVPALEAGKAPDLRELSRQLSLANEHPAKRLTINIKESRTPNALDADVKVLDVPSQQTFIALTGGTSDADNTINRNTGYTRLTLGHQQSNLFDLDHALTLTYTTSPDHIDDVMQVGAFYWLPLYGYNTALRAFWSRSDVDSGSVGVGGQSFDVSGRGEFYGLSATYALPKLGSMAHHLTLGIEDRYFKSTVGTAGALVQSPAVSSRPVALRYTARAEQPEYGIGGFLEYVANVDGGRANDDVSYNNARAGASRHWDAFRYGLDANYSLGGGWNLVGRLRGQEANEPLIPGEQFGIGGVASVRGLREREMSGDKGAFINLELHTPAWNGILPFFFYDAGWRKYVTPVAGIPQSDSASSVGIGARWTWEKRLEVSATIATVLNGVSLGTASATDSGHTKLNFSLFYRF